LKTGFQRGPVGRKILLNTKNMKNRKLLFAVSAIAAALIIVPQNSDGQILKGLGKKLKEKVEQAEKTVNTSTAGANENQNQNQKGVVNSAGQNSATGKTNGYKSNDGVVVSYGKTGREDITPRYVLEGEENGVSVPKPQPWYIETEDSDEYGDGVGGNLMKGKVTATFANGVLTIKGTGKMNGYGSEPRPWFAVKDQIVAVVIEAPIKNIGEGAFLGCKNLKSVKLPAGLCEIGASAFESCTSLQSITIPKTVQEIDSKAFANCPANITVVPGNEEYKSAGGVLFSSNQLLSCPTSKAGDYVVPEGITYLASGAFKYCKGLTSVTLPSTMKNWNYLSFGACENLKTVISKQKDPSLIYAYENTFLGVDLKKVTLIIPAGTKADYLKLGHPFDWFGIIVEK
jgi:hypothetical protein